MAIESGDRVKGMEIGVGMRSNMSLKSPPSTSTNLHSDRTTLATLPANPMTTTPMCAASPPPGPLLVSAPPMHTAAAPPDLTAIGNK